jgi:hypothetical protein
VQFPTVVLTFAGGSTPFGLPDIFLLTMFRTTFDRVSDNLRQSGSRLTRLREMLTRLSEIEMK